jgi:SAM-dependent methyltransferase
MPILPDPKRVARSLVHAVTGGGAEFLRHKREYHRRRAEAERRVLGEAAQHPELLRATRCPACGGDRVARRFDNPVGFRFAVCGEDGAVYMDPAPTEETLQRLYNDDAYAFNWLGEPGAAIRIAPSQATDLAALLRLMGGGRGRGRLLDVGCATGGFLLSAAAAGFTVSGVELSEAVARVARAQGIEVTTGRLQDLPGEARFDVITMLQLIEHTVRPDQLLGEARRLLAPGGLLYLDTPNIDSASFAYLGRHHIHVSSFGHVSLFGKASLEALARRCGFELCEHEYWSGRDLALHDLVTFRLSKRRFRHRMSFYSPRLYHVCNLVDELSLGVIPGLVVPRGHPSYQRALFRRAAGGPEEQGASDEPA